MEERNQRRCLRCAAAAEVEYSGNIAITVRRWALARSGRFVFIRLLKLAIRRENTRQYANDTKPTAAILCHLARGS